MPARPYQQEAIDKFDQWFHDVTSEREALIALTVGLGKTFTAAQCAKIALKQGPILWLTHIIDLVDQSAEELEEHFFEDGVPIEFEQADRKISKVPRVLVDEINDRLAGNGGAVEINRANGARIVVASVPSLKGRRLERFAEDFGTPSLIIADEAHFASAASWMKIKLRFPDTKILNLTATPYRADVRARMNLGRVLAQMNTSEGIRLGYLVPPRQAASIRLQLKGLVDIRLGDFEQGSLASLLSQDEILESCTSAILEHAPGRRSIVFGANVAHSKLVAQKLRDGGLRVAEIYDGTPKIERKAIKQAIKDRTIDVIVNNIILTAGFNVPEIDLVAILRPTRSASLYLQMLGRGLRICPWTGKIECLVVDVIDVPKQKGAAGGIYLPSEEDAKRFAAVSGFHYPLATVFLSWFRRKADVVDGRLAANSPKLNSPPLLFQAAYGRPPNQNDAGKLESITPLYKRIAPPEGEDGYKTLFSFLRVGNIETALKVLAISGWKYYPRLEFNTGSGSGWQTGGPSLTFHLEALVENDPDLKNFLIDVFDTSSTPEEKTKEYYEVLDLAGKQTVWYRPLIPQHADNFRYIAISNPTTKEIETIFFRAPERDKLFAFDCRYRIVKDATTQQLLQILPSHCASTGWASLPMSEKQGAIVAKLLNLSDEDIKKTNISRLVASCLITGKSKRLQPFFSEIYDWTILYPQYAMQTSRG